MDIKKKYSLRDLNTFGVDVKSKYFVSLDNITDVLELIGSKAIRNQKHLVLGGGSNILFKNNFDGWVLKNCLKGIKIVKEEKNEVYVEAQGGEVWQNLINFCLDNNLGGVENLSYIPGSVGASPVQNVGAYGVELKDVFVSLKAIDLENAEISVLDKSDCAFGYRDTVFKHEYKNKFMILSVTIKLNKKHQFKIDYDDIKRKLFESGDRPLTIKLVSDIIGEIRSAKLPDSKITGNCGSFFKNLIVNKDFYNSLSKTFSGIPNNRQSDGRIKISAGWFIEQCGWKGKSIGQAGVDSKHALVIVNLGRSSGKELFELSEQIIYSVKDKFGITLDREVNIVE